MSIKVNFVSELNLVQSIFDNKVTINEIKKATVDALTLALEQQCKRFLVDCSKLSHGGSVVEIYSIAEFYGELKVALDLRQAVILPDEKRLENDLRFYETTARNRGYDTMVFDDRNKAIAWLSEV